MPRNRDASAAIAGYVYQVDLTILRWLDLPDSDLLELEAGEDIDRIGRAVVDSGPDQLRILEQVKLRHSSITMRSPEAIEALANAAETLAANPAERIQFRFTTTARVGLERPSPWPGDTKKRAGIDLWQALRSKNTPSTIRADAEATLCAVAATWRRPSNVAHSTWSALTALLGPTQNGLLSLVPVFEWATAARTPIQLRSAIAQRLAQDFPVVAAAPQDAAYQRLFHRVFVTLSSVGRKLLRRDQLLRELADLSSPPVETTSFQQVIALLDAQQNAIGALSRTIDALGVQQSQLLGPGSRLDLVAEYVAAGVRLNTSPPPFTALTIQRNDVARDILARSNGAIWIALFGMSGSGKTQLACDLAPSAQWVRLDGVSNDDAAQRVEAVLGRAAGSTTGWLVLDDLPLDPSPRLRDLLVGLANCPPWPDFRLISTSHRALSARLKANLAQHSLFEICTPAFSASETVELAAKYAAPQEIQDNDRLIATVNSWCNGHPQLLAATCRFLQLKSWAIDSETLNALLSREQLREVSRETAEIIRQTIQDPEARRLLYRTKLSSEPLGFEYVAKLSSVAPSIARARERFDSLIGPWLRPEVDEKFAVSPLVREISDEYLEEAEKQDCHAILAEMELETRRDQWGLISAIAHYAGAKQRDRAATLLIHALVEAAKFPDPPPGASLVLGCWANEPPSGLEPDTYLMLLAAQIHARNKFGEPIEHQLRELGPALLDATSKSSIPAACLAFRAVFKVDPQLARSMWRKARVDCNGADDLAGSSGTISKTAAIEALVWICVQDVTSLEHFDSWVDLTEGLSMDLVIWNEHELNPRTSLALPVDRIWLVESTKPTPDWQPVLRSLRRVDSLPGTAPDLRVRAVRAEITVLADYLGSLQDAESLAARALQGADLAPEHRYLIGEALGRAQLHAGYPDRASASLKVALDWSREPGTVDGLELALTLRAAASAAVKSKSGSASKFASQAVAVIREDAQLPEAELVRNLGEAALISYLERDARSAYTYLSEAAARYLDAPSDRRGTTSAPLSKLVEHTYHLARTGSPPDAAKLGVEFPEPEPNLFYEKVTSSIATELSAIICARLSSIADYVGADDDATLWAVRACAEAYENPGERMSMFVFTALQYLTIPEAEDTFSVFCRELAAAAGVADERFQQGLLFEVIFWIQRLARDSVRDRGAALAGAIALAEECRAIAAKVPRAASSWQEAADLIGYAARGGSVRSLAERTNALIRAGNDVLALVGRASALLAEDLTPAAAIQLQLHLLDGYWSAAIAPAFTRRVIRPYLTEFWTNVAQGQAFHLTEPRTLRSAVEAAAPLPAEEACVVLMVGAADASGVRIPENLLVRMKRAWVLMRG
ncbi:MAG TPA: hypothetical protein VHB79_31015 [Polyangiaceae bacterium]|nr:hypothetical protein [Polyangiaceae bacterium]